MRKVVFLVHTSLDGFVAGPNGEMDWIRLPNALFDFGKKLTDAADAALYGRTTYEMMQAYWPAAGSKPSATKHDREHSEWYNRVAKYVVSRTLTNPLPEKTIVIRDQVGETVRQLKQQPGKNIQIYGSPSVIQSLLDEDLVDEFYLSVNPILLGKGLPLFKSLHQRMTFRLMESLPFPDGIILLHYARTNE